LKPTARAVLLRNLFMECGFKPALIYIFWAYIYFLRLAGGKAAAG